MSKKNLIITIVTGIAFLFIAGGIYAATKVVDEIRLKNNAYSNHKEAVVIFQHRKHQGEYREKNPELYNSLCGDCHHAKVNDKENKPLVNLKEGDEVKNCIECIGQGVGRQITICGGRGKGQWVEFIDGLVADGTEDRSNIDLIDGDVKGFVVG